MKQAFVVASVLAIAFAVQLSTRAAESKPERKAAGAPQSVVYDAESAFEFLKTLTGNWERIGGGHEHGSKTHASTFRVSSGGSSVVETIFPGEPGEMITVYHMDGHDLLLTHYCSLQNAPVMKFVKTNEPGVIKFEFHGGTNFDPKSDMHVHEGAFKVRDANTIEANFVVFNEGKPDSKPASVLKRTSAK